MEDEKWTTWSRSFHPRGRSVVRSRIPFRRKDPTSGGLHSRIRSPDLHRVNRSSNYYPDTFRSIYTLDVGLEFRLPVWVVLNLLYSCRIEPQNTGAFRVPVREWPKTKLDKKYGLNGGWEWFQLCWRLQEETRTNSVRKIFSPSLHVSLTIFYSGKDHNSIKQHYRGLVRGKNSPSQP